MSKVQRRKPFYLFYKKPRCLREYLASWGNTIISIISPISIMYHLKYHQILSMRTQHQTKDGVLIDTVTKHQMFYDEHGTTKHSSSPHACAPLAQYFHFQGKPYWDVLYVDSYTLASNPPTPGSLARKEIPESATEIKNGKNPAKSEPAMATATAKMLDPAPPSAAQPQQPPSAEQNASFYQPNSSSSSSQW